MIGWIYKLFIGSFHVHKWKIIYKGEVRSQENGLKRGDSYYLQCTTCGDVTRRDLTVN